MFSLSEDYLIAEGAVDHGDGDEDCTQPPVLAD
jgi:hypothetical protein